MTTGLSDRIARLHRHVSQLEHVLDGVIEQPTLDTLTYLAGYTDATTTRLHRELLLLTQHLHEGSSANLNLPRS